MSQNMGRPEVHGLDVIKADRVRRTRSALILGKKRRQVAEEIFHLSPKTFRRYLAKDDPRSRRLKRAIEEGEALRGQPLAELICYLLDQRENTLAKIITEQDSHPQIDVLRKRVAMYSERLKQALYDNRMLREHRKTAMSSRAVKRIKHLEKIQEITIESESEISSI